MYKTSNLVAFFLENGGVREKDGNITIPDRLGKGYLKWLKPRAGLTILLQHMELLQPLQVIRQEDDARSDMAIFSFRNIFARSKPTDAEHPFLIFQPSVQASSANVALDITVPAHFETSNVLIGVEMAYLRQLLTSNNTAGAIAPLNIQQQSFLYEGPSAPRIQTVAAELFLTTPINALADLFYANKAEELIYLFLNDLLKRDAVSDYPINKQDAEAVYQIREELIRDLATPPQLELLAAKVNMSVSKLSKLFRYIFGESIYNYYQKMRMNKAIYLLREKRQSVSAVGYELGFSNLSHFSRLFEKHIGVTPKKFSKMPVKEI